MEPEPPANALVDNTGAGHNEGTPMDTDDNMNTSGDNMPENSGKI